MALPKLNDVPMYNLNIPSTGKQVKYRPFLVKEQKILLIAYESQDRSQIVSAIMNCINSCTYEAVKAESLPIFDVDYIFTQIRSKSVGENAELSLKCVKCNEATPFSIDLSTIEIPEVKDKPATIQLTDDIKIKMKYPTYTDVVANTENAEDFMIKFIVSCIQSLQTNEENIEFKDEPIEEKIKFIESLTSDQFDKISQYVNSLPKLTQKINVTCQKCGTHNTRTLEGVENFF